MLGRLWTVVIIAFGFIVGVSVAGAQEMTPYPVAIVRFTADSNEVSLSQVEAGEQIVMLTWRVENLRDDQLIRLYTRRLNGWQLLIDNMEESDTAPLLVAHPQNFSDPAFRLTVEHAHDFALLDDALITLHYTTPGNSPTINRFAVIPQFITPASLQRGDARISGLSWEISNRTPSTNLIFEQVMPDGTERVAELPRGALWLPSTGNNGVVAPIDPGDDMATITLRLKLVDLDTGEVYDEATVDIPVGAPLIAPTASG